MENVLKEVVVSIGRFRVFVCFVLWFLNGNTFWITFCSKNMCDLFIIGRRPSSDLHVNG